MIRITPHGHPLRSGRAPDPHHIAAEAQSAATNRAWVDGTPEYRAAITAELRREDIQRFAHRLATATTDEGRAYYGAMLDQARQELADAEAMLMRAERRIAA